MFHPVFKRMKNTLFTYCCLIGLFIFSSLYSQESANYHFKKIMVDNGLSENTVYCISQDSKGFIWFGTKDGLDRYDGSSFRVFRKSHTRPNSLGNNFIRSIVEGDNNQLFIGTDCGLYIMNTNSEVFSLLTAKTASGVSISTAVNALYLDKNKNLWIGTMSQGVFVYNTASQQLQQVKVNKYSLTNSATWCIYCDKSGIIWIGNRLGLLRYNPDTRQLDPVESLFNHSANSSNFEILSILEDTNGNLWLGTWNNGIELYNKRTNEVKSYFGNSTKDHYISHVRVMQQYNPNALLVGSDDGLYLFNTNTLSAKRIDVPQLVYSMSDQSIYSIYKDKEGGFWFGTYFGGVNYLNESLLPIETYYSDRLGGMLSGKAISQFCEDQSGNMWIATEDGGINYLNVTTKKITQPIKTSYHNIHALLMDGDDLWIGTFSRGVDVYNIKTKRLVNFRANSNDPNTINDDCVFSLCKTRQGDIYIGTPMGLSRYNKATRTFIRIKEAGGYIYDIKEDESGNLWLANYTGGIIQYNARKKRWLRNEEIVGKSDPIIHSKLTGIYIDNHKRIIFCSEGNGIFIYNPNTGKFKNISEKDGLPNNVVYGVLDDAFGNLWISTNKGIACMNLSNPNKYKLFTKDDGLQSNQFNYKSSFKANDGKFYFGGINGFSCFYPHDLNLLKNNNIPRVEITGLELLKSSDDLEQQIIEQLNGKKKIVLPYNKSSFKISYISLSFISQSKNQYAYKLEGVDNDWLYAGNNKNVTYVNLPPGNYTFKVKASNNSGIWNEEGTQIEIVILPPFWWSLPAKILYFILCLILIYRGINYYSDRAKQKQTKVLEAFKTEQETRSYKSKIDFFTNIAHEIRTPLSLIKAPLEEVISSGEGGNETKQNLSIIQKNSNRLSALINQLLDFRKMDSTEFILHPEKINLYDYMFELCERFKKTAQSQGKEFILNLPPDKNIMTVSDADALTKIIGNLMTNAIKFSKSKIIITLEVVNDSFKVNVEDDGKGIPDEFKELIFDPFYQVAGNEEKQGTGLGLSLARKMAQAINGTITVENAGLSGTIFSFIFRGLELEEVQRNEINADEPAANTATTETLNKNKHSVLVVDDNPDITAFIRNCLQSEYQIETASNASTAMELLEGNGFDLIITDIMMPDIDGISFTKRIKGDVNYSHIPIILLSAKTENAVKVEGLRSGAEVFIEKPFSVPVLKAQLITLLENRKTMLEAFNRSPLAPYSSLVTNKKDEQFINKLNEEIEKHLADENFSVESLTDVLKLSRSNLQRKLKVICEVTPGEYLRNYRLRKACSLLLDENLRPGEVAYMLGFSSPSYFTKAFIKYYNMTPKEFLKKHS